MFVFGSCGARRHARGHLRPGEGGDQGAVGPQHLGAGQRETVTFGPPGVDAALEAPKAALKDGGDRRRSLLTRAVPITCVLAKTSSLMIYSFVVSGCVATEEGASLDRDSAI